MRHCKIIGITLTAIASLLTACTEDVMTAMDGGQEITFEVSTKDTNTRASETPQPEIEPVQLITDDGSTYYLLTDITPMPDPVLANLEGSAVTRGAVANTTSLHNGFGVSAYYADGTNQGDTYFLNSSTSYTTISDVDYYTPIDANEHKYWPNGKLNFYAYYPYISDIAATDPDTHGLTWGSNATEITYTVPSNIANQPDLVTATLTNQEYAANETVNGTRALEFDHALCAIKFQTGIDIPGGTIKSIEFSNIYKSGTYNLPNKTWGSTSSGDLSYTGLNIATTSGTSGTNILTSNNNLLMMIPQSFTNANQKITISFTEANGVSHTLSCTLNGSWVRGQCITYTVTMLGIAKKYRRNPLWYVSESNVKSYNQTNKIVTLESSGTTLGSDYKISWNTAMSYFAKQSASYNVYWGGSTITDINGIYKYHLPVVKEWYSVVPSDISILDSSRGVSQVPAGLSSSSVQCLFGYDSSTKAGIDDWIYWGSKSSTIRYAIRFLGTNFCSVWKYDWSNKNSYTLIITAKLIDKLEKNDASLSTKLSEYANKGDTWWNSNVESEGNIRRYFVGNNWCAMWAASECTYNSSSARNLFYNPSYGVYIEDASDRNKSSTSLGMLTRLFRNDQ